MSDDRKPPEAPAGIERREVHDAPKDSARFSEEAAREAIAKIGTVTQIRPPTAEKKDLMLISQHGDDFKAYTIELANRYGAARELSIAQTKIDEAVMWLLKFVAAREA